MTGKILVVLGIAGYVTLVRISTQLSDLIWLLDGK